jgi:hypothetical protein
VDASSRQVALQAETQHSDPCPGTDGGTEEFKGTGCAVNRRFVSGIGERTKMGIHSGAAVEVDYHFHEIFLLKYGSFLVVSILTKLSLKSGIP